jgi:acetyl-CoA C-acetyltransferase
VRPCIVAARRSEYARTTPELTLEELIYETVRGLLDESEASLDDVDHVAIASSDAVDGRAISSMVTAASVGCYARDMLNCSSSGEHALITACLRILAGRTRLALVANWAKPSEAPVAAADRLALDPFFYRGLGLERVTFAALQAAACIDSGIDPAAADGLAAERRAAAAGNERSVVRDAVSAQDVAASPFVAWPLRELHLGPLVDGAVALLVASEELAPRLAPTYAVMEGMGWATDSYWLGDRPRAELPSLAAAARDAYARAGIDDPQRALDVVELSDASPYHELMARDALGIDGAVPVNPSGGQQAGWPDFAFGLDRVAEVVGHVTGPTGARRGLAHAAAGFGSQANSVFVLGRGGDAG